MKFLTQDYYEILDIPPGAGNEDVKRAYRLVRRSFHPESMAIHSLYSPDETEAISAKIDEAFAILSRPESAGRYAKYHRTARPGMSIPRSPETFFDQVHRLEAPTPIESLARAVGSDSPLATQRPAPRPITQPNPRLADDSDLETTLPNELPQDDDRRSDVHAAASASSSATDGAPEGMVPEPQIDLFLDALEVVDDPFGDVPYDDENDRPDGPLVTLEPLPAIDLPEDAFETLPPADRDPITAAPGRANLDALVSPGPARSERDPGSVRTVPSAPPYAPPPPPPAPVRAAPPAAQVSAPPVHARPAPAAPARQAQPVATPRAAPRAAPTAIAASPTAPTLAVSPVPGFTSTVSVGATTSPSTAAVPVVSSNGPSTGSPASVAAQHLGHRPRRWTRETVRTRSVGNLGFEPMSREDLDAFEMDSGGMGGEFLKQVRRALGVSVEDIAMRTKIGIGMLRYIEADEVELLPARVYLRGYLTQIGRLLKLPVPEIVDGYMRVNGLGKQK